MKGSPFDLLHVNNIEMLHITGHVTGIENSPFDLLHATVVCFFIHVTGLENSCLICIENSSYD